MQTERMSLKQISILFILIFFIKITSQQVLVPNPINYWSFAGDYTDSNGGANLMTGAGSNSVSFSLGPDRFGNANSSLYLKNGWVQIPPGIYISGPNFTISHWIYSISSGDFIPIQFSTNGNQYIGTQVSGLNFFANGNSGMACSRTLPLNAWYHLAYAYYPNNTMTLFINGSYACSKDNCNPPGININRTTNYIGANPQGTSVFLNGYIDEIKIYNVGLTGDQMMAEFNNALKPSTPTTILSTTTTTTISTISSSSNIVKLSTPPIDLDLNFIHPVNYWSFDNILSDSISGSLLYGGSNYKFVNDHLNNPLKAIRFNHGFLQMPAGDYFPNNKFTITAWVNYVSFESNDLITLIDFGNPNQNDNIILSIVPVSNQMSAIIFQNKLKSNIILSFAGLSLNTWYHIAYVYDGTNGYLYINGNLVGSASQISPNNMKRNNCLIGKSNFNYSNSLANAIYDELKIYKVGLTSDQIANDMNNVPIPISTLPFSYSHIGNFYLFFDVFY